MTDGSQAFYALPNERTGTQVSERLGSLERAKGTPPGSSSGLCPRTFSRVMRGQGALVQTLWVSCCLFSELKVVSKTWLSVSWLKDFLQVPDSAVCVTWWNCMDPLDRRCHDINMRFRGLRSYFCPESEFCRNSRNTEPPFAHGKSPLIFVWGDIEAEKPPTRASVPRGLQWQPKSKETESRTVVATGRQGGMGSECSWV